MIVSAPARTAGQIALINQTPWPVVFTITRIAGQLGALGVVGEQVAQQQARPLDVAAGLLDQVEQPGVEFPPEPH